MKAAEPYVYRPLGLTLAILSAIVLFGGWPLLRFYISWRLSRQEQDPTNIFLGEGGVMGAEVPFDAFTIFLGIMGLLVIFTALVAWWGKPPQIRFIFQATVLITSLSLIGEGIYRVVNPSDLISSSIDQFLNSFMRCQLPFQILMTLYIIWYCNRAPARAFYRQEPMLTWQQLEAQRTSQEGTQS